MRARRVFPLLLVLSAVALVATGCFESNVSDTTISGEITIGQGTSAQTVNPAQGESSVTGGGETSGASTGQTSGASSGESSGASTGAASGADVAAGKAAFTATCGGCHTLKDAGTSGKVGPDLDSLAPLSVERVAHQIENGGAVMPPKLLTGADAANVAAYVASVAGK
jgi:mono/diheme cytochrome c family protein